MAPTAPAVLKHKTQQASLNATYRPSNSNRHLQFAQVHVAIFAQTAGDNPSVEKGPPITLAWEVLQSSVIPLAEENPTPSTSKKYPKPVLVLTSAERVQILLDNGLSMSDIQRAQDAATIARNRRNKTLKNLEWAQFDESLEELRDSFACICQRKELLPYPMNMAVEDYTPPSMDDFTEACPICRVGAGMSNEPASYMPMKCHIHERPPKRTLMYFFQAPQNG